MIDVWTLMHNVIADFDDVKRWWELSQSALPHVLSITEKPITDAIVYGGAEMRPHYEEWKALTEKLKDHLFRAGDSFSVERAQLHLRKLGYEVEVDGVVGRFTTRALRSYQESRGLKADGWMGPQTEHQMRKEGA